MHGERDASEDPLKLETPARTAERPQPNVRPSVRPVLVIDADSQAWWRRTGPLAWTVLQHLALRAHHGEQGWTAPLGVRDIAAGLGVTKDTAARAIATLATAGLVTRGQVDRPQGGRRSGYVLHLPDPVRLVEVPANPDTAPARRDHRREAEFTAIAAPQRRRVPRPVGHPDDGLHRRARPAVDTNPPIEPCKRASRDQPGLFTTPPSDDTVGQAGTSQETA